MCVLCTRQARGKEPCPPLDIPLTTYCQWSSSQTNLSSTGSSEAVLCCASWTTSQSLINSHVHTYIISLYLKIFNFHVGVAREMAEQARRLNTLLGHLKASSGVGAATRSSGGAAGEKAFPAGRYRYTLDASSALLSQEQRQFYEENGFLIVKGLVPQHKLDLYRERFRQICTREVEVGEHVAYYTYHHMYTGAWAYHNEGCLHC